MKRRTFLKAAAAGMAAAVSCPFKILALPVMPLKKENLPKYKWRLGARLKTSPHEVSADEVNETKKLLYKNLRKRFLFVNHSKIEFMSGSFDYGSQTEIVIGYRN